MELAARIGQKLLADNQSLHSRNEYLEEQLLQATDKVLPEPRSHRIFHFCFTGLSQVTQPHDGLQGFKNRPAPFHDRMSQKATKPGSVSLIS